MRLLLVGALATESEAASTAFCFALVLLPLLDLAAVADLARPLVDLLGSDSVSVEEDSKLISASTEAGLGLRRVLRAGDSSSAVEDEESSKPSILAFLGLRVRVFVADRLPEGT
ncbi:MAG: hypothetical protein WCA35_24390 [Kovacikia sp.]